MTVRGVDRVNVGAPLAGGVLVHRPGLQGGKAIWDDINDTFNKDHEGVSKKGRRGGQ